jgi:hypothetical protein
MRKLEETVEKGNLCPDHQSHDPCHQTAPEKERIKIGHLSGGLVTPSPGPWVTSGHFGPQHGGTVSLIVVVKAPLSTVELERKVVFVFSPFNTTS